jgi:hypothetical protein
MIEGKQVVHYKHKKKKVRLVNNIELINKNLVIIPS